MYELSDGSTFLWNFVIEQIKPEAILEITLLKINLFIFIISLSLFTIVGQLI